MELLPRRHQCLLASSQGCTAMHKNCKDFDRKCSRWRTQHNTIWQSTLRFSMTILILLLFGTTNAAASAFHLNFNLSENLPKETRVGSVDVDNEGFILIHTTAGVEEAFNQALLRNQGIVETIMELNREDIEQYNMTLYHLVSENTYEITVTVLDVNDNAPTFAESNITLEVSELSKSGAQFNLGSALDHDAPPFNVQGYRLANPSDYFSVETTQLQDGTTRFAELVITKQLDRELIPYHIVVVEAFDGGKPTPLTGKMTVNVSVSDSNDNPPVFSAATYNGNISEGANIGDNIVTVKATDRDAGVNGDVTYSIDREKSDPEELFKVNSETGVIYVSKKLDSELATEHRLTVLAKDAGAQPLTGSAVVIIRVEDINDNAPRINVIFLGSNEGRVSEGAEIGDYIARISVSDPDVGDVEKFNVTMTGGDGRFGLETENNIVYLVMVTEQLNREEKASYDIVLNATDFGSPPRYALASFTIEIEDINDNPPIFDKNVYEVEIGEESYPGTFVIHLSAEDPDIGINKEFQYSLEPSAQSDWFHLNSESGLITTATHLDYEINHEPHLVIVATDFGVPRQSSSATVVVKVKNANDSVPVFNQTAYSKTISENTGINECFLQVKAIDPDFPDLSNQILYTFADDDQPVEISLDETNGQLCVDKVLDRETKSEYNLRIKATDKARQFTFTHVTIKISDVNDNPPVFHPVAHFANIAAATAAAGDPVAQIQATDSDDSSETGSGFGIINYKILNGNEQKLFAFDNITGEIFVAKRLVSYGDVTIQLRITATDGGGLSANQDAIITITILNDTIESIGGPVFDEKGYEFEISENADSEELIGTVSATASDLGSVSYYLRNDPPISAWFTVDENLGAIKVASSLDREIFSTVKIQVIASTGSPPVYGFCDVIINIDDVNDNSPVFNIRSSSKEFLSPGSLDLITVPYTFPTSKSIYTLNAVDPDFGPNSEIVFSLLDDAGYFSIDASSGVVSLMTNLPQESRNYSVIVKASDRGTTPKSTTGMLVIQTLKPDGSCPSFSSESYTVSLAENAKLVESFKTIAATSTSAVTYEITASADSYKFGIYPNGGVYLTSKLDRELEDSYQIEIVARGVPTFGFTTPCVATATVDITVTDINDNVPYFDPEATRFTIKENLLPGSVVGTVSASDGDIGENGELRYSIANNDTYFEIDPISGVITTTKSLDFESISSHALLVRAMDISDSPLMSQVSVRIFVGDVNDNAPQFFYQSTPVLALVRENLPKDTFVTVLQAFDIDGGNRGRISYSIKSGGENLFKIDANTGRVSTKARLSAGSVYSMTIEANDNGSPAQSSSIDIQVRVVATDSNPAKFNEASYVFFAGHEVEPGAVLGRFDVQISSNRATRSINARNVIALSNFYISQGNLNDDIYVDTETGELYAARKLSFESEPQYTLTVTAENSLDSEDVYTFQAQINVEDTNDFSPTFSLASYSLSVQENAPINTKIWKFTAFDGDVGVNGEVVYSIVNQTTSSGHFPFSKLPFTINSATGELYTNDEMDRESIPEYIIVVKATDSSPTNPRSTTVSAVITVQDMNDNRPRFVSQDSVYILEDELVGFPILNVQAEDDDLGPNAHVTYSIVKQWSDTESKAEAFQIEPVNGLVTLIKKLNYESASIYYLNISATDSAALDPLNSYQFFVIYVVDVNDEAPLFTQNKYYAEIEENEDVGTLVARVTATDRDSGPNGNVTYEIFDKTGSFEINQKNGVIVNTKTLDRETKDLYSLTVYAHDGAFPSLYTWCEVEVSILDQNDNSPNFAIDSSTRFTSSGGLLLATLEVPEYDPGPTLVYNVLATDKDSGENGRILYSIRDGNTENSFTINSTTGEVWTSGRLNWSQTPSYRLKLVITDNGQESRNNEAFLDVSVLDWNDNDPVFTKASYHGQVVEGLAPGQFVLTVHANDADDGLNAKVTYSIDPGTSDTGEILFDQPEGLFSVDPDTGVVTTTETLDREKKKSHQIIIQATDSAPYGPRKTSVTVTVDILDVNDNYPIFAETLIIKNVSRNIGTGSDITTVSAQDKDEGDNGTVHYRISGGTSEPFGTWTDKFQIDSFGKITTTASLSGAYTYHLNITASDNGSPPNTAEAVVVVNVVSSEIPSFARIHFQKTQYEVLLPETTTRNQQVTEVAVDLYDEGGQISTSDDFNINFDFASGNDNGAFFINNEGVITVKDPEQLDYEKQPVIRLIVSATSISSSGASPMYDYCTVLINLDDENDNAPKFAQDLYITRIWEEQEAGAYMMQVVARDEDSMENGEVRYYIDSGNTDGSFHIDDVTGIITTALKLDRETYEEYKLTIYAYDMGDPRLSGVSTVKVTVVDTNDNKPTLNVPGINSIYVSESLDVGKFITRVTASDRDTGTIEFQFANDGNNQNDYFTIDRQDGSIHLAKALDYEMMHQAKIVVQATDGRHKPQTEIIININDANDNPPVFDVKTYQAAVDELSSINTPVVTVHATDADTGLNADVSYHLIDIVPKKPLFYINSKSGTIFTNMSEAYNPQSSIYNLIVMAEDAGDPKLNCTIPVRIEIKDINDHAPLFNSESYKSSVSEAAELNTHVITLTAQDGDFSNENKRIYYRITAGNDDGAFQIDTISSQDGENTVGQISVASELDRENISSYTLTVTAFDQGSPQKSRETIVTVTIDDVNDNQPIFNQTVYTASIPEDAKQEAVVQVFASDPDSSSNLMFKITAGNDDSAFEIGECVPSSQGCALISAHNLDYETQSSYNLTVQVWDGRDTSTSNSSIVPVKIQILDVNEHPPYFTTIMTYERVSEAVGANETVFTLPGEDSDGGEYGKLYYTIINGELSSLTCRNADEMFYIEQITGEVKSRYQFDYEKCRKYNFIVRVRNAVDGNARLAKNQSSSAHPVEIVVLSVDEFSPVFQTGSDGPTKFIVSYAAPAGYVVGQVNATDDDAGPDGTITYTMDEDPYFVINSSSGVITLVKKLDSNNNLVLTVYATSGEQTAKTFVSIEIKGAPAIAFEAQILAIVFGVIAGIAVVIVLILCIKHWRNKKSRRPAVEGAPNRNETPTEFYDPARAHAPKNVVLASQTRLANGKVNSKKTSSNHQSGSGDMSLPNGAARHSNSGNGHVHIMENGTRSSKSNSGTKISINSNGKIPHSNNGHVAKHIAVRNSVSSGRGSVLDCEDVEVDMINSSSDATNNNGPTVPKPKIRRKLSGQGRQKKHIPDSGIQKDIDVCSDISEGPNHIRSPSVESIHVFGDEGAGEEPLNIQDIEENLEKEIQNGLKDKKILSEIPKNEEINPVEVISHYKSPLGTESNQSNKSSIPSKRGGESIGGESGYSRRGRHDNWAPEFQRLADVFSEVARLKDRENAVRTGKHNGFVMKDLANPPTQDTTEPPPLITSVAEQRSDLVAPVPLGYTTARPQVKRNVGNSLVGLYPNSNPQYVRVGHSVPQSYLPSLYTNPVLRPNAARPHTSSSNNSGPGRSQVAFNVPQVNNGASSINSSQQGLSVSSLPRTPISHESSFTSPAMSPNLTPSLSPLATRSPSVSTVDESVHQMGYDSDDGGGLLTSKSDPNLAAYVPGHPSGSEERMLHV